MTSKHRSAPRPRGWVWLVGLLAAVASVGCGGGRADHVIARRVEGELPRMDPVAAAWDDAPEFEATLQPQNVVAPQLAEGSVSRVRVRALHDGTWVAVRLEWDDATDDHNVTTSTFSDACAVQFPTGREVRPSPMMGNDGAPVDIVYFRAAWQTTDNMGELYPNMPPIYHPAEAAAEGEPREQMALQYQPATHAGNPTVVRPDGASVVAFSAAGFGSLSPTEGHFAVQGRGEYREGHWYVVLAREIGDASSAPLAPGQRTAVAVAIWNGSHGEVGSRKNRSDWLDLEIEGGGS
ncbi:MAG: ethylbenzene dehydrogenase-related protein [Sandaracinus sp.]